ncbi:hypothetical protein EJ05DRAFT_488981 [Pseudovirgaria hyperparasitica]|uniref:Uncharacterized protein n=1 Tax=Pseudovirgaria hyperparasitica TaxID=470096 RepID=A0A6A6VW79_9PEZI|nr:uncharacterized protein EJ05DRAFT_488981 [Pseudovirgaria hyperparasitica]KAF2754842.1 hypothetical protein EJ05DRAFT_488981 [Pseudovirgaria hyperparasitica]
MALKGGQIQTTEFWSNVLIHYQGVKHDEDLEGCRPWLSGNWELEEIRKIVLSTEFVPVQDTTSLETLYMNARNYNGADVSVLLAKSNIPESYVLQPLLYTAAREGNFDLFSYCIDHGADISAGTRILNYIHPSTNDTRWLDLLHDLDFMQWKTKPKNLSYSRSYWPILQMGPECIRWWLHHGGTQHRARYSVEHAQYLPPAPAIRVFLEHFGLAWFRDSGFLQFACQKGDMESVVLLVEAGADVNEDVTPLGDDLREGPVYVGRALDMALIGGHDALFRYLLQRGARVRRSCVRSGWAGRQQMVDLIERVGAIEED